MASGVTVVIPVWNGRAYLVRLMEALKCQTAMPERILIVDNGSTDGAPEEAERSGADVIRLYDNLGFATAVNRGVQETKTPLIAIVNSDVVVGPDWLERLVAALSSGHVWFATGKLYRPDNRTIDGAFDLISRGLGAWRAGSGQPDYPALNQPRVIALASMTATLYRRSLFDEVGLLEPVFESYLEDVDFALRAALLGYTGWYEPLAVATHVGSASLGRWHPDTVRRLARNQIFLIARHFPPSLINRYWRSVIVTQVLWGIVALRHGRLLSYVRGKVDGVSRFHELRRKVDPPAEAAMVRLVEESERDLMALQEAGGWDRFWRWYRRLAPGKAD